MENKSIDKHAVSLDTDLLPENWLKHRSPKLTLDSHPVGLSGFWLSMSISHNLSDETDAAGDHILKNTGSQMKSLLNF